MATQLQLVDYGVQKKARYMVNNGPDAAGDLYCALGVSSTAFVCSNTLGSYTECTATSYSRQILNGAAWVDQGLAGCVAHWKYVPVTFFFGDSGGGQTIYKVFILDTPGNLVAVGDVTVPYPIPSSGGAFTVVLEWLEENCP